jgi:dTDP-4-dehydrorhamnose reductase
MARWKATDTEQMKILLIGSTGQVGWELNRTLSALGDVFGTNRSALDIEDGDAIRRVVREIGPNVIINAAAYTAVDRAESEPDLAKRINGAAPGILGEEAKRAGALLVHYSTDYVFNGRKNSPYTEEDEPNPLNVYGQTKLEGEQAVQASGCRHYTLRTSWVYAARGSNFLLTMLRLARKHAALRIVNDQVGAPTWSRDIAAATASLLRRPDCAAEGLGGLYNLCADGSTSWYGFARSIFASPHIKRLGIKPPALEPIPTCAYPTPAVRPANSRLNCSRLASRTGVQLGHWGIAVDNCLAEL